MIGNNSSKAKIFPSSSPIKSHSLYL